MSDATTSLGNARFDGYVTVTEDAPRDMVLLKGDLSDTAFAEAVGQATGGSIPAPLGLAAGDRGRTAWMAPDELLLVLPRGAAPGALARLAETLGGRHHLALDVSDMRAALRLEGDAVREVLAKVTPIDMVALDLDTIRRTRISQAAAALWLSDDRTAHVICFRSMARYVFDVLAVSARKGGEIGRA